MNPICTLCSGGNVDDTAIQTRYICEENYTVPLGVICTQNWRKKEMTTDILTVAELAHDTVLEVMTKGQRDGKRGWEKRSRYSHLGRASTHIESGMNEFNHEKRDEHYTHALTRIAMAMFLRKDECSESERGVILKGNAITKIGYYWYRGTSGTDWEVANVFLEIEKDKGILYVNIPGVGRPLYLLKHTGDFIGPITPPDTGGDK